MCKVEKELDNFHRNKASKDGHTTRCKECAKAYNLQWQAANPEKAKYAWRTAEAKSRDNLRSRARKYGLTKEELESLIESANGVCEICKRVPDRWLVVDHCHNTEIVRGMLCERCNQALGLLADNTEYMYSAIEYITKHQPKEQKNDQA